MKTLIAVILALGMGGAMAQDLKLQAPRNHSFPVDRDGHIIIGDFISIPPNAARRMSATNIAVKMKVDVQYGSGEFMNAVMEYDCKTYSTRFLRLDPVNYRTSWKSLKEPTEWVPAMPDSYDWAIADLYCPQLKK